VNEPGVSIQEELLEAKQKIFELEAATKTTLLPSQLLVIILVGPLFLSFTALGILITFKTLNNPATISPHIQNILLVFAIFSTPVTAAAATICSLMADEIKARLGGSGFNNET
jgi:hypothetical protein